MEILIEAKYQRYAIFSTWKISMDTFTCTITPKKYPWIFWQDGNARKITKHHESTFDPWTLYAADYSFIHLVRFSSDLNTREITLNEGVKNLLVLCVPRWFSADDIIGEEQGSSLHLGLHSTNPRTLEDPKRFPIREYVNILTYLTVFSLSKSFIFT